MDKLAHTIKQLEIKLFQADVRSSPQQLDWLIADDFKEFMSTGDIYFKKDALIRLPHEQPLKVEAGDFEVKQLADGCALIRYRSIFSRGNGAQKYSLRSSIWQMLDGRWQIVFHQGTLCPAFKFNSAPHESS